MANLTNEEIAAIGTNVQVAFRVVSKRKRVFNGYSTLSDTVADDEVPVSFQRFRNSDEASVHRRRLGRFNDPHICKTIVAKNSNYVVMLERLPGSLQRWISRGNKQIWTYSHNGDRILSMAADFTVTFWRIGKALLKIHEDPELGFHGNLKRGVRVSNSNVVKLFNIVGGGDDDEGKKKDVRDFMNLVKAVVVAHPQQDRSIPPPRALNMFYHLCIRAQFATGRTLRNYCYFIFCNALFFNGVCRYHWIFNLWDYANWNLKAFYRKLTFRHPLTNVLNWHLQIDENPLLHPEMHRVLNFSDMKRRVFAHPQGIIDMHMHAYAHTSDYVLEANQDQYGQESGCTYLETEEMLHRAIPDAIPSIFFETATKLAHNSRYQFRGNDLVECLKSGTHAIPGIF